MTDFRVGMGQDSHRFEKNNLKKPLVLGGFLIPKVVGLEANSDGDVVLHALFNALSTAIAGHSLGFYDKDLFEKGMTDSQRYIEFILKKVRQKGYNVNNLAIMIEAKTPKLEAFQAKMKEKIAHLLGIKTDKIGIAITSGEELTAFGKGEGIQALAVVSLIKK